MAVKRYHAQNVQDALRAVRQDLGSDALVLSTRLVAAHGPRGWFGGRMVELTAAADRTEVAESRPLPGAAPGEAWPDRAARRLVQRLTADEAHGTPPAPTDSREGRRAAALALLSRLGTDDRGCAPIEVFVGAPGAGTTTVVAAIAARARVRADVGFGLVSVAVGNSRSHHGLSRCAGVVGAPLATAPSAYELQTVLERTTRPVLVDVDGGGPGVGDVLRLLADRADVRVHLVIAADAAPDAMRASCEWFRAARPTRAVVTRVDLATSAAAAASLLRDERLPVSYLYAGPRVPEDLLPMSPSGRRITWSL